MSCSDCNHPLKRFYPTVGGSAEGEDPFPAFRDFVATHIAQIKPLIETRVTVGGNGADGVVGTGGVGAVGVDF